MTSDTVHNQEKESNCGQPRRNDSELSEAVFHFCCSCELNDLGKQPCLSKPQRPDPYSSELVNEKNMNMFMKSSGKHLPFCQLSKLVIIIKFSVT